MKVRTPAFDFSAALPNWCPDREFGAMWNAASMMNPTLEPFLNRVVMRARNAMKGKNPAMLALRKEIETFVAQEGNHYKLHEAYNTVLRRHYPGLAATEAKMRAYYDDIFRTKSMRFLTGFCESFEMVGPVIARIWLDSFEDLMSKSQPVVVNLWKWHWSEEYEHRTTCFRVHALYSKNYAYRLGVLAYTQSTLKGFQKEMVDYMLEVDRASMSAAEREKSIANAKRWNRILFSKMIPPLLRGAAPFYSPVNFKEPKNYAGFMAWFEEDMKRASQQSYVPMDRAA